MSNEIAVKPVTDLSEADMAKIKAFAEEGMPGLAKMDETDLYRMTEMYLSGSTYHQISSSLNIPRTLVLYVSHTYDWYGTKKDYLVELDHHIKGRVITSNLISQDFLLLLVQAYQKKIGKNLQRYLATDNPTHTEEIDLKEVDKLLKVIDMIKELNSDGKNSKGKTPAVGLNLGEGVTIERSGDKVTITPKERVLGNVLSKYAERVRAEEGNKPDKKQNHDIEENVTKKEE